MEERLTPESALARLKNAGDRTFIGQAENPFAFVDHVQTRWQEQRGQHENSGYSRIGLGGVIVSGEPGA